MNGRSRKYWPPRDEEQHAVDIRTCDHPGCAGSGEYRAPKARHTLKDYYWFCLEHVRAYNAAWDFNAGLRPEELEQLLRSDITWQRPTWPLGRILGGRYRFDPERVKDPFNLFEGDMWRRPAERAAPNPAEETAMRVMDLKAPLTLETLKARYKELCKRYHPDANGGDKGAEERFKQIGQAYKTLRESLNL